MGASTACRTAASAVLVATAVALLVLDATQASFTSRTGAGTSFTAGVVRLGVGPDGPANRLTVDATGVVPGDRIERVVDVVNQGTLDLTGVTVTTAAGPSSALDTDTMHGLQVAVDRCSVPWAESGSAPAYAYSCGGVTSVLVTARPVITGGVALPGLAAAAVGGTDHLRVVLTLPATAGDSLQGLTSRITFTVTAMS